MKLKDVARLLFSFRGRSPRSSFWAFNVYANAVHGAIGMAVDANAKDPALFDFPDPVVLVLVAIYFALVAGTVVSLAAFSVRRLHDVGLRGWPGLVVPAVFLFTQFSLVSLIVFGLPPGQRGPNRYGPDPREREGVRAWARTRWPADRSSAELF